MTSSHLEQQIQFDKQGLIPAIVQDWLDATVLMVGFMNRDALETTLRTGYVHFWSRSRQRLWKKGETSGHYLQLKRLFVDCDLDTLLVKAQPLGPTCHTGRPTCFFAEMSQPSGEIVSAPVSSHGGILDQLYRTVLDRKQKPPEQSYVSSLLAGGTDRVLKKVLEESGEVLLAAKNEDSQEIVHEVADLVFHLLVMLGRFEIPPQAVYAELGKRFGQSGLRKKEREEPPRE